MKNCLKDLPKNVARTFADSVLENVKDFSDQQWEKIQEKIEWSIEHVKEQWKRETWFDPIEEDDDSDEFVPAPGTPGAKAVKDQDILEGRKRNVRVSK